MGNAGSAHNLHNDCVASELNSYCTEQYLRRTTGERRKKYNEIVMGGWSSGRNITECKVLPRPTENLKLRATSNGAILQAGGTISFRAKEQADLERKNETDTFHPMRRCHTLMLDSHINTTSQCKSAAPLAEFRRSQTLLHVDYNRTRTQDNVLTNFESSPQSPAQNTSYTLKVNKYNKKRKAPPAPIKTSLKADSSSAGQNLLPADPKKTSLPKPRIYATNSNKALVTQKTVQSPSMNIAAFQRNSNTRISVNSSRAIHQTNPPYFSKLPYRREKSFDAKLLRQRETNDCNDKRCSKQRQIELPTAPKVDKLEEKLDRNVQNCNSTQKLSRHQHNVTPNRSSTTIVNTCHLENNSLRDRHKIDKCLRQQETIQFNLHKDSKNNTDPKEDRTLTNERKPPYQQSRIPQLKRTFYFGMESSNKSSNINCSPTPKYLCRSEKMNEENEDMMVLNHNLEAEEEIVDNGILVHVRPILPRRQPETPNFNPAAAWRNLVEEQQRLQLQRLKSTQNSRIIETPICLTPNTKENYIAASANWTPEQDLEDDDDDNEDEGAEEENCKGTKLGEIMDKDPENFSNSLHIFSLSLPRDVHLQCAGQENSLKAANCWLVPGFNSLQKFKTHLGKNIDFQLNSKCTCAPSTTFKRNSYQLENIFGDPFAVESKNTHQPDCELNKTSPGRTSYKNDNWLLHKSNPNDASLTDKARILDDSSLKPALNALSLVNLQPKSLTNICGGKHIVYLPGQNAFNVSIKDSHKTPKPTQPTKSTYARQRQRQEIVRQSLQDLTPIQNIHQSNVSATEKNTHRFSFQSTVRVLEKRRLAEKLSKDAEIQEAQRLNELEAMKRVEEDFQKKRAPEKANLRNQLRLHLKAHADNGEYRSLPININEKDNSRQLEQKNQQISDVNNNIFCRAEPDGAVSPSLDLNDSLPKIKHSSFPLSTAKNSRKIECFEFDGDESESETPLPDLQCTALLIEPYLHSII